MFISLHAFVSGSYIFHAKAAIDLRLQPTVRQGIPQVCSAALDALNAFFLGARAESDADQLDAPKREQIKVDLTRIRSKATNAYDSPENCHRFKVSLQYSAADTIDEHIHAFAASRLCNRSSTAR